MSERSSDTARQVKALIHKARTQLERGQPQEAMKLFQEVLQLEPQHPHVQQWVAKLQGRMKKTAGIGAPAGGSSAASSKLSEETVLSSVKTDSYPSARADAETAGHKAPARPRTKKPRSADPVDAVELDTTVLGMQPGVLDRTVPLMPAPALDPPAPTLPPELDATVPGRFLRPTERAASTPASPKDRGSVREAPPRARTEAQVSRPVLESLDDDVERPLDTTDPDVASLLSGSARGSAIRRLSPVAIIAGGAFLIGLCFVAFHRHSNMYRAQLDAGSLELSVQRGAYFFSGWGDPQKIAVGYDAAWQQRLGKPELLEQLQQGVILPSAAEVDQLVVSIYTQLGDRALERGDSASLLEAIFYLKGARRVYERSQPMPPEELPVRQRLMDALLQFADYRIGRQEMAQAKDTLEQVRQYDSAHPGIAQRLQVIEQPPPTPEPKDVAKPGSKKPAKKPTKPPA